MGNVEKIIKKFGGINEMARIFDRDPSAVSRWKDRGIIPAKIHVAILKEARRRGIKITANDIVGWR